MTNQTYNVYEGGSTAGGTDASGNPLKVIGTRDQYGNTTYTNPTTQTTTPTTTGSNAPVGYSGDTTSRTIGDAYGTFLQDPDQYMSGQGITESSLKQKALAEMQAEIDAQNALFARKLSEAKTAGYGRIGQSTAIQARRGMLGSDFGAAITEGVNRENQGIYDTIEAERVAKIESLKNAANKAATDRYKELLTSREGNLKARLEYLKGKEERDKTYATQAADTLIAQGFDISKLDNKTLEDFAAGYGVKSDDIKNIYLTKKYTSEKAKKDEEEKRKADLKDALAKKGIENISEGASGYRFNPDTNQYELVASVPKTYKPEAGANAQGYVPGSNPAADNWAKLIQAGQATITNVPAALRSTVASALAVSPRFNESLLQNVQLVNSILEGDKYKAISGGLQWSAPFSQGKTTSKQYDQLKGVLALANRQQLKGSGAISDFESKTLERAASSLSRLQNEEDFKSELQKVRGVFQTAAGMKASVKVTGTNGQVDVGELSRDEINSAIEQGYQVEYQ